MYHIVWKCAVCMISYYNVACNYNFSESSNPRWITYLNTFQKLKTTFVYDIQYTIYIHLVMFASNYIYTQYTIYNIHYTICIHLLIFASDYIYTQYKIYNIHYTIYNIQYALHNIFNIFIYTQYTINKNISKLFFYFFWDNSC